MSQIKISAVSYINSLPFVYGIKESGFLNDYDLSLDVPSVCAEKLKSNQVDIGLIPAAMIPEIRGGKIITDYCIGATGRVKSVILASNTSLKKIKKIYLDNESRSSVKLAKILAENSWNITPEWVNANISSVEKFSDEDAAVLIGDKVFLYENSFNQIYDLAEEWQKFTSLPFVFACWVSNKDIPPEIIRQFNDAVAFGIEHKIEAVEKLSVEKINNTDIAQYIANNICYDLDEKMYDGLRLFLNYLKR